MFVIQSDGASTPKHQVHVDAKVDSLERIDILPSLNLLVHECGISLHLFRPLFLSSVLCGFSVYRSHIYFVRFIWKYLIFLGPILNGA